MPAWSTVRRILDRLETEGLVPQYQEMPAGAIIDWMSAPPGVDPSDGLLEGERAQRKRWQVENLLRLLSGRVPSGSVIVDFGASSGHLGLPVAACFPDCHVFLVDKKPRTMDIARRRIAQSGLRNVEFYPGYVEDVTFPFHIGIGLHVCGDGTDRAQSLCLDHGAMYVLAPCCIGFIQRSSLPYPRSRAFARVIGRDEYNAIASAADWTCRDWGSEQHQRGKVCMGVINMDRNRAAEECGYRGVLYTMTPPDASPKNEIIDGSVVHCNRSSDGSVMPAYAGIHD